jgi:tetratricopeptide (TPR) repeat protein
VPPEFRETLLTQLATHLLTLKDYAGLQKLFQTPLGKSAPLTASMHFVLGLAEMEQGRYSAAAEQMRNVLAKRNEKCLSPLHKDIRKGGPNHCLALCYKKMKEPAKAMKAFEQAWAEDPQSRAVRYDYARFLAEQGQPVDALKLLYELVKEDAGDFGAWILGAKVALEHPELREFAQDWTEEAARNCPDCQPLMMLRGEALILKQDIAEAREILRNAGVHGSPKHLAALVLCEVFAGGDTEVPQEIEANVSQQFMQWYRQLLYLNAVELVKGLNNRLEIVRKVLPSAAQVLEQALLEAEVEAAA